MITRPDPGAVLGLGGQKQCDAGALASGRAPSAAGGSVDAQGLAGANLRPGASPGARGCQAAPQCQLVTPPHLQLSQPQTSPDTVRHPLGTQSHPGDSPALGNHTKVSGLTLRLENLGKNQEPRQQLGSGFRTPWLPDGPGAPHLLQCGWGFPPPSGPTGSPSSLTFPCQSQKGHPSALS